MKDPVVKKFLIRATLFVLSLLISSCGKINISFLNLKSNTQFLGVVPSLSGAISRHNPYSIISSAFASSCMQGDVNAELYALKVSGELEEEALAKKALSATGRFDFDFTKLKLNLSDKIDYVIAITGCEQVLFTPVLELGKIQVIDYRSTFITSTINSDLPVKLNEVSRVSLQSLVTQLSGNSVEGVRDNLIIDMQAAQKYNDLFGVKPEDVKVAPLVSLLAPSGEIPENQVYTFSPVVEKVDADSLVYEWTHKGVVVSTTTKWAYHPAKNDQGLHSVILKVGKDNGSGGVDLTLPYFEKTYKFNVANTYFPVAPALILGSGFSNTNSIVLNFNKSECSTFSSVAITEKSNVNDLVAGDFIYTCSDSDIVFNLSSGDGQKRIYSYSKDIFNDISPSASSTIILDSVAPVITSTDAFFALGGVYSGLRNEIISWIATDAHLGLNPMTLSYSVDLGVSWIEIITSKTNDGLYTWNLPEIDGNNVRLKIEALDQAGNIGTLESTVGFSIDSTPPSSLIADLDKLTTTNSLAITATVASCSSDQKFMMMNEVSSTPTRLDSKWVSCSDTAGALTHHLSAANGSKNLYLWAKDLAGNISLATTKTIIYDSVAPVIALNAPLDNSYINNTNKAALTFSGTCSENVVINVSGEITDTINCASGTFSKSLDFTSVLDGVISLELKTTDTAGNNSNTINLNLTKDIVLPIAEILTPNASSYVKNSMILTGSCSEEGRNVLTSGSVSATAMCSSNAFSATLNLSAVSEGTISVMVNQTDLASNSGVSNSRSFTKDTIAPVLTQTLFTSGNYANTDTVTFGGNCESGGTIEVSGHDSHTFTCSGGTWNYTTSAKSVDGTYSYTFSHMDAALNSSLQNVNWKRDTVLPQMQSILLAEGATYVGTSFVVVDVSATDNNAVASIRLKSAHTVTKECQSEYADDNWQTYSSGVVRYSIGITPGDGEKKVCAWAKDRAGNVTSVSPVLGTPGVNTDSVFYEIGNPPQVIAFDVKNESNGTSFGLNNNVVITWTITDIEELNENPVALSYTTSSATTATWTDINLNYGNIGQGQKTYTGSYTTFKAPSGGYFRVRLVAKDIAGNTSLSSEKTLNTGNWSVFAGSTDSGVGGSAQALSLKNDGGNSAGQYAAIDPKTNDAYLISATEGMYKLDAVTGNTSIFIKNGTSNLVDGQKLDANSAVNVRYTRILFDNDGFLYLMESPTLSTTLHGLIWKIDVKNLMVKKYLGGGSNYSGTSTATAAYVQYGAFTFDESNSLYYLALCSPGANYDVSATSNNIAVRLMKAIQNPLTKEVASTEVVAGNCVRGHPTTGIGVDALSSPFYNNGYLELGSIASWDNGKKIYYGFSSGAYSYKIINGVTYRSNVYGYPYYDFEANQLYIRASVGRINTLNLDLSSSNGDITSTYVSSSNTGSCMSEGVDRLDACVVTSYAPIRGPSGKLAFLDGALANATGKYSLRYVDDNGKIKTYAGAPPFYGQDLHKSFVKSDIAGIYYKKSTEMNQSAFPEGLYFLDRSAMVMGYINPSNDQVSLLAGNQSKSEITGATGDLFDTKLSLGIPYSGGTLTGLVFNNEGLPLMRTGNSEKSLIKVEANKTISFLTSENNASIIASYYDMAETGDDPARFGLFVQGGYNNLAIKDEKKLFLLGAYIYAPSRPGIFSAEMKLFNYENHQVTHVMGVNTTSAAISNDNVSTFGDISDKQFSGSCSGASSCYLNYIKDEDRIYFSEDKKLRYITTPENPATSTLKTLFTSSRTIQNYIFSENNTQVFYISNDGKLYCKDLSSGKSWCNETSLGPTTGMSIISRGANQLTWKDATTLLISTYSGMIYQYNLLD